MNKHCGNCEFGKRILVCNNPKNYQPQVRQYMIVKPFSPRFYPEPPNWCKGWELKQKKYYLGNGVFAASPPPELPVDWIEHVQEPDEEFLELINKN